ncbi:hypothetical protein ACROYT_G039991 [Oculina patagonica]
MNYHTPLNYTWANKSSFNSKMVNMGTTHNEKFIVSFNIQTRIFQPTGNFARVKKRDGNVSTVCKCQSYTSFGIDNISLILNNRFPRAKSLIGNAQFGHRVALYWKSADFYHRLHFW